MAWRHSFQFRLILGAVVWIAAGVAISGLLLSQLFARHVNAQFDSELADHSIELQQLLQRDGAGGLRIEHAVSDLRFQPPGSGFYWQVDSVAGVALRSESLRDFDLRVREHVAPGADSEHVVRGPTGPLLLLTHTADIGGLRAFIGVGMDTQYRDDVLADFTRTLIASLMIVALGLTAAAYLQIRYGLRPLDRIRKAVAAVRSGKADKLPPDLPIEVAPLVGELNALMEANQAIARNGRIQAGNLAHALKNPLAILMDEGNRLIAAGQAEAGRTLLQQCERMRRHIEYHLAQARAAASPRSGPGAAAPFDATVHALVSALARVYHEKPIAFDVAGAGDGAVLACSAEEANEIFGNLIDNAAKWARTRVRIAARISAPATLSVRIEDDGPGMPEHAREVVFEVGKRLDEQAPGSGLGLAIVREIVGRCGGKVWLEPSAAGGTAACVALPLVAPA